jgi:hypothetical protein
MKSLLLFIGIFFSQFSITSEALEIDESLLLSTDFPCPAYHEETRSVLNEFLLSERFLDDRKRLNIEGINPDSTQYLSEHQGCRPSESPSRLEDDFIVTYYSATHLYFRVAFFKGKSSVKETGMYNFDNRSHSVIVYDSTFKNLGGVLF